MTELKPDIWEHPTNERGKVTLAVRDENGDTYVSTVPEEVGKSIVKLWNTRPQQPGVPGDDEIDEIITRCLSANIEYEGTKTLHEVAEIIGRNFHKALVEVRDLCSVRSGVPGVSDDQVKDIVAQHIESYVSLIGTDTEEQLHDVAFAVRDACVGREREAVELLEETFERLNGRGEWDDDFLVRLADYLKRRKK